MTQTRSALDRFTFDGVFLESEVFTNDFNLILEKGSKSRGRKKSKKNQLEESIYNPHNNSEDDDGSSFNELQSILSYSRISSQ